MTADDWRRVKDALGLVMTRPPGERAEALDLACGDDDALRREVAALLESGDAMGDFLAAPLPGDAGDDGGPLPSEGVPRALAEWTRYEALERIGAGGMAVVYKAWDPRLRRTVAVKVISEQDPRTVARFVREAEVQARVEHDNVLKVFETGLIAAPGGAPDSSAPRHYIAMQFVDGPTLGGVRAETTLDEKVRLMAEIAEGLHAAHRLGLVHRDIKPGNVLVERGSDRLKPYLLDFGLAAEVDAPGLTQTGVIVGTPRYMAPERIQRGDAALDRRSDVYSLGATFYELLCGVPPFDSSSGLQVLVDVLEHDVTPLARVDPGIPPEIGAIVETCMQKDPSARYPSARAVADDLRRYLDGEPVLARPAGRLERAWRRARRNPRLAAAFATLAIALAASAGWGGYQSWRGARQAELAAELGRETQDVEWLYRAAQMSPLHAIAPQRSQVRDRMARIERAIREAGRIAIGPGEYALGRGFQTLGDDAAALLHLERAWASGYRTADAAMALGLAHGRIFRAEMLKAQRIANERDRAARTRALEAAHLQPALALLAAGRSSRLVPPTYVDALIAAYGGRVAETAEKSRAAARATPWLFEAHLLAGQTGFREALRLHLRGERAEAAQIAAEADRRYAEAERIAESAVAAHVGRCAIAGLALDRVLQSRGTEDPAEARAQAERSCGRALLVDPADTEALRLFGEAVAISAAISVQRGEDPGDGFGRAAALTERAIAAAPADLEAQLALADIFLNRAWWEGKTKQDPRGTLDRAIAIYERVFRADPRNVTAADNLGQALMLRARYEAAHGLDASATLDRAVAMLEACATIDPSLNVAFNTLSKIALQRADDQARRGVDASPGLLAVVRFIETLPADAAPPSRAAALQRLRERLPGTH